MKAWVKERVAHLTDALEEQYGACAHGWHDQGETCALPPSPRVLTCDTSGHTPAFDETCARDNVAPPWRCVQGSVESACTHAAPDPCGSSPCGHGGR